MKLTPLSFSFQPSIPFSGSAQSKSQRSPWSGISTGLTILRICSKFYNCGLNPPCMHMIFSSMRAHTGMTLKTSEKSFQSFKLYFLLPWIKYESYISHKNHRFYLYLNTHDFLLKGRNFQDIWFCMITRGKCTRWIVFLCQYSHLRRGS
jgi:hypothetical protein